MKNASILLPSKQSLFEDRGDAEERKRGVFFACNGHFSLIIGIIPICDTLDFRSTKNLEATCLVF